MKRARNSILTFLLFAGCSAGNGGTPSTASASSATGSGGAASSASTATGSTSSSGGSSSSSTTSGSSSGASSTGSSSGGNCAGVGQPCATKACCNAGGQVECVFTSATEMLCEPACTQNSDCSTNCCSPFQNNQHFCMPTNYCSGGTTQ